MKKLSKLKLNVLSDINMRNREMNLVRGGNASDCCGCGCNGSSSTYQNGNANSSYGYGQSYGGNKVCAYWYDSNGNGIFEPSEGSYSSTC
jgi:natural product precursor